MWAKGVADAEESEIESARLENGNRPSRSAFQRRADRFTRRIGDLRHENQELRAGLERALVLIDRLRSRKKCQTNSK